MCTRICVCIEIDARIRGLYTRKGARINPCSHGHSQTCACIQHTLKLANNRLASLGEVENLRRLKMLATLTLDGNPLAQHAHARPYAIFQLPTVDNLDEQAIGHDERQQALTRFGDETLVHLRSSLDRALEANASLLADNQALRSRAEEAEKAKDDVMQEAKLLATALQDKDDEVARLLAAVKGAHDLAAAAHEEQCLLQRQLDEVKRVALDRQSHPLPFPLSRPLSTAVVSTQTPLVCIGDLREDDAWHAEDKATFLKEEQIKHSGGTDVFAEVNWLMQQEESAQDDAWEEEAREKEEVATRLKTLLAAAQHRQAIVADQIAMLRAKAGGPDVNVKEARELVSLEEQHTDIAADSEMLQQRLQVLLQDAKPCDKCIKLEVDGEGSGKDHTPNDELLSAQGPVFVNAPGSPCCPQEVEVVSSEDQEQESQTCRSVSPTCHAMGDSGGHGHQVHREQERHPEQRCVPVEMQHQPRAEDVTPAAHYPRPMIRGDRHSLEQSLDIRAERVTSSVEPPSKAGAGENGFECPSKVPQRDVDQVEGELELYKTMLQVKNQRIIALEYQLSNPSPQHTGPGTGSEATQTPDWSVDTQTASAGGLETRNGPRQNGSQHAASRDTSVEEAAPPTPQVLFQSFSKASRDTSLDQSVRKHQETLTAQAVKDGGTDVQAELVMEQARLEDECARARREQATLASETEALRFQCRCAWRLLSTLKDKIRAAETDLHDTQHTAGSAAWIMPGQIDARAGPSILEADGSSESLPAPTSYGDCLRSHWEAECDMLQTLQDVVVQVENAMEALRAKTVKLERDNSRLCEKLTVADVGIAESMRRQETAEASLQQVRREVMTGQSEQDRMLQQLRKAESIIADIQDLYGTLDGQIDGNIALLEKLHDSLRSAAITQARQREAIRLSNAHHKELVEHLTMKESQVRANISVLEQELNALKMQCREGETNKGILEAEVCQLRLELDKATAVLAEHAAAKLQLQDQVRVLQDEVEAAGRQLSGVQQQDAKQARELQQLQQDLAHERALLCAASEQLRTEQAQLSACKADVQAAELLLVETTQAVTQAEAERNEAQAELASLQQAVALLRQERDGESEVLQARQAEVQELNLALETRKGLLAASVREHHGRQREYRNRERELDAALHDKRLLLQDLNHHAKRLGADVASFGDCLAALQEAEHEREMQRQNVEKQECDRATVREREYERKRQEQQELEEELRLLQTKLAAVRQELVQAEQEAVSAARERERRESARVAAANARWATLAGIRLDWLRSVSSLAVDMTHLGPMVEAERDLMCVALAQEQADAVARRDVAAEMQEKLARTRDEILEAEAKLSRKEERANALEMRLKEAQAKVDERQQEVAVLLQRVEGLSRERDMLEEAVASLTGNQNQLLEQQAHARSLLKDLEDQVGNAQILQQQHNQQAAELATCKAETMRLREMQGALDAQVLALKQDVSNRTDALQSVKAEIDTSKTEVVRLKMEADAMANEIASAETRRRGVERAVQALQEEQGQLTQVLQQDRLALDQAREKIEEEMKDLNASISKAQERHASVQAEVEAEVARLQQRLEASREEYQVSSAALAAADVEARVLASEGEQLSVYVSAALEQLSATAESCSRAILMHKETLRQLESRTAREQQDLMLLCEQCVDLAKEMRASIEAVAGEAHAWLQHKSAWERDRASRQSRQVERREALFSVVARQRAKFSKCAFFLRWSASAEGQKAVRVRGQRAAQVVMRAALRRSLATWKRGLAKLQTAAGLVQRRQLRGKMRVWALWQVAVSRWQRLQLAGVLRSTLASLELDGIQLHKEVDSMLHLTKDLKRNEQLLLTDLDRGQDTIVALQKEASAVKREYEQQGQDARDEQRQLASELEGKQHLLDAATAQVCALEADKASLASLLDQQQDQAEEWEKQVTAQAASLEQKDAEIEKLGNETNRLAGLMAEHDATIARLERTLTSTVHELEQVKGDFGRSMEEVARLSELQTRHEHHVIAVEHARDAAVDQVAKKSVHMLTVRSLVAKTVETMRRECAELGAQLATSINETMSEGEDISLQLDHFKELSHARHERIVALESMLATTREEVGQVKSRLSGSREEVLHLTHINTQLQASVIELERRSTREGEEVQQLMQSQRQHMASIAELEDTLAEVHAKFETRQRLRQHAQQHLLDTLVETTSLLQVDAVRLAGGMQTLEKDVADKMEKAGRDNHAHTQRQLHGVLAEAADERQQVHAALELLQRVLSCALSEASALRTVHAAVVSQMENEYIQMRDSKDREIAAMCAIVEDRDAALLQQNLRLQSALGQGSLIDQQIRDLGADIQQLKNAHAADAVRMQHDHALALHQVEKQARAQDEKTAACLTEVIQQAAAAACDVEVLAQMQDEAQRQAETSLGRSAEAILRLQTQKAALEKNLEDMEMDKEVLRKELEKDNGELQSAVAAQRQLKLDLASAESQARHTRQALEHQKAQVHEHKTLLSNFTTSELTLKSSLESARADTAVLQKALSETQEELGQVKATLSSSREEVLHLTQAKKLLQASIDQVECDLAINGEEDAHSLTTLVHDTDEVDHEGSKTRCAVVPTASHTVGSHTRRPELMQGPECSGELSPLARALATPPSTAARGRATLNSTSVPPLSSPSASFTEEDDAETPAAVARVAGRGTGLQRTDNVAPPPGVPHRFHRVVTMVAALRAERDEMQHKIQRMRHDVTAQEEIAAGRWHSLQLSLEAVTRDLERCRADVVHLQRERSLLQANSEQEAERLSDAREQCADLERQLADLMHQLCAANAERARRRQERSSVEAAHERRVLAETQALHDRERDVNALLSARERDLDDRERELEKRQIAAQAACTAAELERQSLEHSRQAASTTVEALERQVTAQTAAVRDKTAQLVQLERQVTEKVAQLDDARQQLRQEQDRLRVVKHSADDAEGACTRATDAAAEGTRTLQQVQSELVLLRDELLREQEERSRCVAERKRQQHARDEEHARLAEMRHERLTLGAEVEALSKRVQHLREQAQLVQDETTKSEGRLQVMESQQVAARTALAELDTQVLERELQLEASHKAMEQDLALCRREHKAALAAAGAARASKDAMLRDFAATAQSDWEANALASLRVFMRLRCGALRCGQPQLPDKAEIVVMDLGEFEALRLQAASSGPAEHQDDGTVLATPDDKTRGGVLVLDAQARVRDILSSDVCEVASVDGATDASAPVAGATGSLEGDAKHRTVCWQGGDAGGHASSTHQHQCTQTVSGGGGSVLQSATTPPTVKKIRAETEPLADGADDGLAEAYKTVKTHNCLKEPYAMCWYGPSASSGRVPPAKTQRQLFDASTHGNDWRKGLFSSDRMHDATVDGLSGQLRTLREARASSAPYSGAGARLWMARGRTRGADTADTRRQEASAQAHEELALHHGDEILARLARPAEAEPVSKQVLRMISSVQARGESRIRLQEHVSLGRL